MAVRHRYYVHFTPTYSFWLNRVEIWFNIVTQKAIGRGTFGCGKELVANRIFHPSVRGGASLLLNGHACFQSRKESSDYVNVFPGHNTLALITSGRQRHRTLCRLVPPESREPTRFEFGSRPLPRALLRLRDVRQYRVATLGC